MPRLIEEHEVAVGPDLAFLGDEQGGRVHRAAGMPHDHYAENGRWNGRVDAPGQRKCGGHSKYPPSLLVPYVL